MLVPVLMGKLPEELKLIISTQLGKNIWDVQVIIELFRKELEAREKISVASETKSEQLYSGSSFYAKMIVIIAQVIKIITEIIIAIPCWPLLRRPLLALILASWRYSRAGVKRAGAKRASFLKG